MERRHTSEIRHPSKDDATNCQYDHQRAKAVAHLLFTSEIGSWVKRCCWDSGYGSCSLSVCSSLMISRIFAIASSLPDKWLMSSTLVSAEPFRTERNHR